MNTVLINSKIVEIGKILRIVREKRSKLQLEIAQQADISVSMLSQIERGLVSPSIDTLFAVSASLDLDVAELFRRISTVPTVRIYNAKDRLSTKKSGARYEQLMASIYTNYPFELFLLEVEPGRTAGALSSGHEGIEMGYVLQGIATLIVGAESYTVSAGDSVCFSCQSSHSLSNTGEELFKAVWSVAPPHTDFLGTETTIKE